MRLVIIAISTCGAINSEGIDFISHLARSAPTIPSLWLFSTKLRGLHPVSQSVSYFTVPPLPPRAHPSTGSQSGSATPGLTQSTEYSRSRGLLNCRK